MYLVLVRLLTYGGQYLSLKHPLTLSPFLTLSPSHSRTLSPSHPLTFSPSHTLTLSHSHTVTLSREHPLTQTQTYDKKRENNQYADQANGLFNR